MQKHIDISAYSVNNEKKGCVLDKEKVIQLNDTETSIMETVLISNLNKAIGSTATIFAKIDADRKSYDAESVEEPLWEGAPQLTIPYIKSTVLALEAEIFPTLLDIDTQVSVETIMIENDLYADAYEKFLNKLNIVTGYTKVWKQAIHAAARDRSSVIMLSWKKKEYNKKTLKSKESIRLIDNKHKKVLQEDIEETEDIYYDYPKYDLIDIKNFFVLPSFNADIQDSPGIAVSYIKNGLELIELMNDNELDKTQTILTLRSSMMTEDDNAEDKRDGIPVEQLQLSDTSNDDSEESLIKVYGGQKYQLYDVYYRYKSSEDWLFTIDAKSQKILRATPTPWWGTLRPFIVVTPYSNETGIYAECIATLGGRETQNAVSQAVTLSIGQGIRQVNPRSWIQQRFYEAMLKLKEKYTFKKPGIQIPIPNEMNPSEIRLAEMGGSPQSLVPLVQLNMEMAQGWHGINDARRGANTPGQSTATEVLAEQEGSKKILGLVTTNIGQAMADFELIREQLIIQFSDRPLIQQLWNDVNNGCGFPLEEALRVKFNYTAQGSFATSRFIKSKIADETLAMVAPMMDLMGLIEEKYDLLIWAMHEKGIKNAKTLLGEKSRWVGMVNASRRQLNLPTEDMIDNEGNQIIPPEQEMAMRQEMVAQQGNNPNGQLPTNIQDRILPDNMQSQGGIQNG